MFSVNRCSICRRRSIPQTTSSLYQLDSIQHHRWDVGGCDLNRCSGTCAQHNPFTRYRWVSLHHLNYWRKRAVTCAAVEENHQSACCALHPVPWLVFSQFCVVFVNFIVLEAWHEASAGGGRSNKAAFTWNTDFRESWKTSIKLLQLMHHSRKLNHGGMIYRCTSQAVFKIWFRNLTESPKSTLNWFPRAILGIYSEESPGVKIWLRFHPPLQIT